MNRVITLDQLALEKRAIVKQLHATGSIRRRLLDIGLVEGTTVECVLESPFHDPVAYFIRGTLIAIRKEDACTIEVMVEEDDFIECQKKT